MEIKHIPHLKDKIITKVFGRLPNGEVAFCHQLTNNNGMELQLTDYGATLTSLKVPLQNGTVADVVLGFDSLQKYIQSFDLPAAPYLGATIGRFAGRINQGVFTLNEQEFQLNTNNYGHTLHGGSEGFSQKIWMAESNQTDEGASVTFTYLSRNQEEGFPGNVALKITYVLTESNEVKVRYSAISDEDTIINLTHHSYFNLDGHQSDLSHQELYVNSALILETNETQIPTGRFLSLNEHQHLFNPPKKCPVAIDDTFILSKNASPAASLMSSKNALKMNVFTDQPAVHIYVGGNCFKTIKGKDQADYHTQSGICFETQNFPDAPNHRHFPSAVLKKGAIYQQQTTFKFENIPS